MSPGDFAVEEWEDDVLILPLLDRDRRWSAYALCDLDPPYRQNTRIVGARDANGPVALILLYALPGVTALLPFGDDAGIRAILDGDPGLPSSVFYISESWHLPALAGTYSLDSSETMIRMTLNLSGLRSRTAASLPVERLTPADGAAIVGLYRLWGPTFFDPLMLQAGIYYGVRSEGDLVAVAGTHVVSPNRGIGAIGGVFTHPDYRGRGLATATTGAVARDLAERGIELVVLNVRADNAPAVAAYTRLGFRLWLTFREGRAARR
jgi:ribosomal protein S18 acetylase RimI-like enzyme